MRSRPVFGRREASVSWWSNLLGWLARGAGCDRADVLVVLALLLISCGLWEVSRAAALAVPGVVLLWLALPPRPPFVRKG